MIEYLNSAISLTEVDKKPFEKSGKRFCIGKEVPVEIHILKDRRYYKLLKSGRIWNGSVIGEIKYGTVTALDPTIMHAGLLQPKGLFLDGADILDISKVVTLKGGKDVTKFLRQSFGAAL